MLEYLWFRNVGIRLQPDVVLVNFDWSDPWDDYAYNQKAYFDASGMLLGVDGRVPESTPSTIEKVKKLLSKHSYAYQFFALRLAWITSSFTQFDLKTDRLIFLRESLANDIRDSLMNRSCDYLSRIRDLAEEKEAQFVIHA